MTSGNKLNLGKLGEDTFSLWCTQAELVSNRSNDEDATGWDHLVEFPYIETNRPKDSWNAPIECKVQVKSTQRKDRRLSIKSSALKRLIDYSYPAFILFLEFDKKNNLENSFLVHIDKTIIDKVLREIRKNHISKIKKELHKLKISISYSDKHKISDNTGLCFRDKVISFIPNSDINKYQENKNSIIKNSGFDDFNYHVKFNSSPKNLREHIYQSVIRGREKLEIDNFEISENRFNLPDGDIVKYRSQSGLLIITPSVIEHCTLYFKKSLTSPAIIFKAEVFSLPKISINEDDRLVLRSPAFSIIVIFKNDTFYNCKIKFIQDKLSDIQEILKTLKVIQLYMITGEIVFGIDLNGYRQFPSKITQLNINYNIVSLINPLEIIINHFNLDYNFKTTLDYLSKEYVTILAISKIISNDISNITYTNKNICNENILTLEVPFIKYIELDDNIIGVSCIIITKRDNDNHYIGVEFNEIDSFLFTTKNQLDSYVNDLNSNLKLDDTDKKNPNKT